MAMLWWSMAVGPPMPAGKACACVTASFPTCSRSRVPHSALVFREMWDTTNFDLDCSSRTEGPRIESSGIPHLAKNERDMGHPASSRPGGPTAKRQPSPEGLGIDDRDCERRRRGTIFASDHGSVEPQISPLPYAPVEMTNLLESGLRD